jgi:hypothetical protein
MLFTLFVSLLTGPIAQADSSLVCRNLKLGVVFQSSSGGSRLTLNGSAVAESAGLGSEREVEITEEVRFCETGRLRGTYVNIRHFNSDLPVGNEKIPVACEAVESFSVPCADDFFSEF